MATPAPNIFDTLAQQDTQRTQHDQSVAPANQPNVFDQIAANNGQAPATPPAPKQPEGAVSRFASGVADPFKSMYHGVVDEPTDMNEIAAHTQAGQGGLVAYRMAKQLMAAHEGMVSSSGDGFRKAAMDFKNSAIDMLLGNKKDAIMHGLSGAASTAAGAEPGAAGALERPHELSEGGATGGDLATPLGKTAADAAMIAATEGAGRAVSAVRGAGEAGEAAGATHVYSPETKTIGQLVKGIKQGEKVAQAPAKAAVRGAVGAEEETPLLEGNKTVVDEHLKGIATKEKAAYQKMDEAAGFDVKAERETLKNDQYKLKQLGNTEADQTAREKLTESISDSQKRISDAEKKMTDAGVDPKEADLIHKQRMAGQEFKKMLVQHVSPDGASINVDGLLNASKKLRFSKFGDRLEQYMGKEGAAQYMEKLEAAQKAGAHAMKMQEITKWLGRIAGVGVAGEAAKHLLPQ